MKLNKIFGLAIMTMFMFSVVVLADNVSAADGTLHVYARNQDNDGDGYIILKSFGYSSSKYLVQKNDEISIDLSQYPNLIEICFEPRYGWENPNRYYLGIIDNIQEFYKSNVNHDITVYVNFYSNKHYRIIFWIEGGWYQGSKNIYHSTWDKSVRYLEWNVAGKHWNNC
ncbi:MAG: hypothetical protein LBR15_11065 [Methanobrevibacter sp.]|jgi:hypothetical protein|nr:hypothetical protein [Candidatus Methanovirga australis]